MDQGYEKNDQNQSVVKPKSGAILRFSSDVMTDPERNECNRDEKIQGKVSGKNLSETHFFSPVLEISFFSSSSSCFSSWTESNNCRTKATGALSKTFSTTCFTALAS